jgi:hypothetical protein
MAGKYYLCNLNNKDMKKEYKIVDKGLTEVEINELGEDRWLLVSHNMVLNNLNFIGRMEHHYIFVRDKE